MGVAKVIDTEYLATDFELKTHFPTEDIKLISQ